MARRTWSDAQSLLLRRTIPARRLWQCLPTRSGGWGYISSGTWSLVGVELQQPVMTESALAANFTNEGGVFGTTRFLKNVMGLWLLQECQRNWQREGHATDYDTLLADVIRCPAICRPDRSR